MASLRLKSCVTGVEAMVKLADTPSTTELTVAVCVSPLADNLKVADSANPKFILTVEATAAVDTAVETSE